MAYQTYITEALVCGSSNRNTSDRTYFLFTRDGGMVRASARSVRKETSKQRYALQDFSYIRASLVSGKAGWRIAGVESFGNLFFLAESREARALVRNIVRLLRRTVQGEEAHQELFDDVISSLRKCNELNQNKLETILSLRTLYLLGYVSPKDSYTSLLNAKYAYDELGEFDEKQEASCRSAIEHALLNSQL